ncbi:MAG: trigger factor [Myxococcales bacterium]|nr:trigger factor [Myxococcales bacterium]
MSVQVDQLSSTQKRIAITVPQAEVKKKVDEAFKRYAGKINLPGFRRGHIPRNIIEAKFGKQIRSEVASDLMNFKFREAAVDVEYLGQPEVENAADLSDASDFSFAIKVQVKPSVQVSDYVGVKVDFPLVQVGDDQVEAQVRTRLGGAAKLVAVEEDRAVERGDLVLTEIAIGDRVVESGTMVNTAGDRYYPGVDALVVGLKKGESVTGSVAFGPNAPAQELRGQSHEARITVHGIQISKVPELSDEVATELGYEGGVEAMRAAIRMQEESTANEVARNQARVNLLQVLLGRHAIDVPPAMVDSHLQLLLEELRIQAAYRGRDPRNLRYNESQMADLRERAAFAARSSMLLDAVARAEGIVITDDDLDAKYQEIADMRGQRKEAIKGYFAKDNAVEELRKRLSEERTLDWLLERAELQTAHAPSSEPAPAEPLTMQVAADVAPDAEPAPKKKKAAKKKAAADASADEPAE